jgi:glycosyltransferase involved in cell wall biosynthesis
VKVVLWESCFDYCDSFSNVSRSLILELLHYEDLDIHIKKIYEQNYPTTVQIPAFERTILDKLSSRHYPEFVDIHIKMAHPSEVHTASDIGYTVWEYTKIHPEWARWMNLNERARYWVPSHFTKNTFIQCGVWGDKIDVVPHGINNKIWNPTMQKNECLPKELDGKFLFYSLGTLDSRKNFNTLVDCFKESFEGNKNVALVIFTNDNSRKPIEKLMKETFPDLDLGKFNKERQYFILCENPAIIVQVLAASTSSEYLAGLIQCCNVFVTATHGEGFGIPLLEAMALGKPVIAPYFSGYLDFIRDGYNGMLVDMDSKLVFNNPKTQFGYWAEVRKNDLCQTMQKIYTEREHDWVKKIVDNAFKTALCYSWEKIGKIVYDQILKASRIKIYGDAKI